MEARPPLSADPQDAIIQEVMERLTAVGVGVGARSESGELRGAASGTSATQRIADELARQRQGLGQIDMAKVLPGQPRQGAGHPVRRAHSSEFRWMES
jgi:hypothetical protein